MGEVEKHLIVGLGNPGRAYVNTRHNVGWHIVHSLATKHAMTFKHSSHLIAEVAQGEICEKKSILLLPTTFMNSSGDAVRRCIDHFKVSLERTIVVCDDFMLPFGNIRLRSQGSSGGHNGLKSIQACLNTQYYARLKVGVGSPEKEKWVDYVLGPFSQEEMNRIEEVTVKAMQILELWMRSGIAVAMQTANIRKLEVKKEEGEKNG